MAPRVLDQSGPDLENFQNYSKSTRAKFPDLQKQTFNKKKIYQKMAWASNLQKEQQNRKDSMCWEKKINFVFLLARWWKKLARVFLCILRKHVLFFSFNERSEYFCAFSSFLSLFWDRVECFFVSIKQQKRDFTPEIWASRIMMRTKKIKILNR